MLHPAHGDQIVEGFEQPVAHAVFRQAVNARVMPDGHFGDGKSMHQRERGEKPVHAFVQTDALQHRTPKYLERASRIMHAVVSEPVPHAVGDQGRQFLHQTILPLLPPSAYKVVAGREREKFQNIFAVLLEIAVDLDDDFAGRPAKSRIEGAGLAVIPIEVKSMTLKRPASRGDRFSRSSLMGMMTEAQGLEPDGGVIMRKDSDNRLSNVYARAHSNGWWWERQTRHEPMRRTGYRFDAATVNRIVPIKLVSLTSSPAWISTL
jgi:hypothetical protein